MATWQIILIWIVVYLFLFGHATWNFILPEKVKFLKKLKAQRKNISKLLHRDYDIASLDKIRRVENALEQMDQAFADGSEEALKKIDKKFGKYEPDLPSCYYPEIKGILDLVFFLLILAFGGRALLVQAFQIPTGSMQPTLYGIHYISSQEMDQISAWKKPFYLVNEAKNYGDEVIRVSGDFNGYSVGKSWLPFVGKFFAPMSEVYIGTQTYLLPGTPNDLMRVSPKLRQALYSTQKVHFDKDEVLFKGYRQNGDHLFVNRTYLAFNEPKRGDILVFTTTGLTIEGVPLSTTKQYYIKRLVGLPGDTLKIKDDCLWVKESEKTEFVKVDGKFHPAFDNLYSGQGGYHGYCHLNSPYLSTDLDEFVVPEKHYFMLGDNSRNSQDGRFFGAVPRCNFVGKALFVWWPFTRRWGFVDSCAPEKIEGEQEHFKDNFDK